MADIKDTYKKGETIVSNTDPRASGTAQKNYTYQKYG